jgi:hypothetical protein
VSVCTSRRAEEAAAAAEIARIEDEANTVNQKFSSLADEAAEKTKKLSKLWKKYQVGVAPVFAVGRRQCPVRVGKQTLVSTREADMSTHAVACARAAVNTGG